jgi:hypothetical protein
VRLSRLSLENATAMRFPSGLLFSRNRPIIDNPARSDLAEAKVSPQHRHNNRPTGEP